ncbi:putative E3 ubiquitin-protein ligase ARI1 [Acorus calamus]|uniref:RBR-type E3 ubiquitin transferase n=1 Tax=Acorus calamus TaxID=4465 RepID=A0AAV9C222_ACOCL|nr:putative E3 ubiquitin-protein ligase ARI1 [Acorus calamus]
MEDFDYPSSDYEEEDEENVDEYQESITTQPPPPKTTTQIIRKESLLAAQSAVLRKVMDLLTVKEHHARTLLIHHRWDVDNLFSAFVDKGRDRLFSEAGVSLGNASHPMTSMTCLVCMDDAAGDMTAMGCGHGFCDECWSQYLVVVIGEGRARRVRCMAHKCGAVCDEDVVRRILVGRGRADVVERFDRSLLESYIEDNRRARWCPSVPHCGNAIRAEGEDLHCNEVECACGLQFCFGCGGPPHSPCSCLMWEKWNKKNTDESENANYLTLNTKPCPKCSKHVEKNGGCNHMTCRCGQSFCWVCGGATGRDHGYDQIMRHSCSRYIEDHAQGLAEVKRMRDEHRRYLHYSTRYDAHVRSLRLEEKHREGLREKVGFAEDKDDFTSRDFQWVMDACVRLFRSRRVLMYSYAFAYYMFGEELFKGAMTAAEREVKKNLFEDQQEQLEGNVERLSGLLEEGFYKYSREKMMEFKMHVLNSSTAVDTMCKNMYACVEDDLLGGLVCGAEHPIAPYRSGGVQRAPELAIS